MSRKFRYFRFVGMFFIAGQLGSAIWLFPPVIRADAIITFVGVMVILISYFVEDYVN